MRTILKLSAVSILAISLFSCGSSNKLPKVDDKVQNTSIGKEVSIPCTGAKYNSDKKFFRATQSAKSQDMSLARDKALTNTKERLALLINTKIKSVAQKYTNEFEVADKAEFQQRFQRMTKEVANQTLVDVRIICEKTTILPNGLYQAFYAVEVNKEEFYGELKKGINKDQKLKIRFNEDQFKKVFNEEMEKYKSEQGQ